MSSVSKGKYLVSLLCSEDKVFQIDLLNERIDTAAIQILIGLPQERTLDDVRAVGDVYLYPRIVVTNRDGTERFRASIVERIVRYIDSGRCDNILLMAPEHRIYRQHWDMFGLSLEMFAQFHMNILDCTYHLPEPTATGSFSSGAKHVSNKQIWFSLLHLQLLGDDGERQSLDVMSCSIVERGIVNEYATAQDSATSVRLYNLNHRHGHESDILLLKECALVRDGIQYIPRVSFLPSFRKFVLATFCEHNQLSPHISRFLSAASLYCPFEFLTVDRLVAFVYAHFANDDHKPTVIVGHCAHDDLSVISQYHETANSRTRAPFSMTVLVHRPEEKNSYLHVKTSEDLVALADALAKGRGEMLAVARTINLTYGAADRKRKERTE